MLLLLLFSCIQPLGSEAFYPSKIKYYKAFDNDDPPILRGKVLAFGISVVPQFFKPSEATTTGPVGTRRASREAAICVNVVGQVASIQ